MIEMQTLWECKLYGKNGRGEKLTGRYLVAANKSQEAYSIFKQWVVQRKIPFQRISVTTTDEIVLVK